MRRTGIAVLAAAAAVMASLVAVPSAAQTEAAEVERSRPGGAVHAPQSNRESEAVDAQYWTFQRRANAEPRSLAIVDPEGAAPEAAPRAVNVWPVPRPYTNRPDRMVGKLFGTDSQGDFYCSGSVVNAQNRSVVMTAGHCVYNPDTDEWAQRMVFYPAYGSRGRGSTPLGIWHDRNLWSHREWTDYGNYEVDVGAVVLRRRNGRTLQSVVGAHQIAFNRPIAGMFRPWGYPVGAPFRGWDQRRCVAPIVARDVDDGIGPRTLGLRCGLTAGSSGGPWLRRIGPRGVGTVASVTSYRYVGSTIIYGPYFGSAARVVYRGASTD